MTDIDGARCADLVRKIAGEIGAPHGHAADAAGMIAQARAASAAAETRMRGELTKLYPAIGWTGEESPPAGDETWLYDPIDGAYHWLQGLPLWASSLVLVRNDRPVFSIVHDPSLQEIFVAETGCGATCNGARITVSPKADLAAAVIGAAIPPRGQVGEAEQNDALSLLAAAAQAAFVVRPMAAASLQLAYVAAGRLDAYFENGRDAADWLAGALLVREAGGRVTDLSGAGFEWAGDGILSTNTMLHASMLATFGTIRRPAREP